MCVCPRQLRARGSLVRSGTVIVLRFVAFRIAGLPPRFPSARPRSHDCFDRVSRHRRCPSESRRPGNARRTTTTTTTMTMTTTRKIKKKQVKRQRPCWITVDLSYISRVPRKYPMVRPAHCPVPPRSLPLPASSSIWPPLPCCNMCK